MRKVNREEDEFIVLYCKKKELNQFISRFRIINPEYKVLNISVAGTGGGLGGTIHTYIVFKRNYL